VKEKLMTLIQIQACDSRIQEIMRKKSEAPLRIQRLEKELQAMESTFKETAERLQDLVKNRRRIEREIEEMEAKIEKSNQKLSNIKSNKEYSAALKEIEDLKNTKFAAEERLLQLLEDIEATEEEDKTNQKMWEDLQSQFQKNKKEIKKELSALEKELKVLQERNKILSGEADQELLKRYRFLKERKGGLAISSVVKGVCQTCHMEIPPQKFRELLRGDALMSCPHCHRMIYWGEDDYFLKSKNEV